MKHLWKEFCRDRKGNFAIMFAIIISLLTFTVAVVIESSRMYGAHATLQDMSDSAALSGAYIAKTDIAGRDETVRESIRFHQAYVPDLGLATNAVVVFDDVKEEVSVTIPRTFPSLFGGILGRDDLVVSSNTVVSYMTDDIDPISIVFALDVSGSMGNNAGSGGTKIDVLKQSVSLLFDELEAAAPSPTKLNQSLRTGLAAYNMDVVATGDMGWGSSHLAGDVKALRAQGGTNSAPALRKVYDQLKNDRSVRTSLNDLREYVVFMTDGDNNEIIADEDSAALCMEMRADGIEIYSVAFSAPEKGQMLLLECASWNSGEPSNSGNSGNSGNGNVNGNNADKCMNNGSQGKGQALGHCKNKDDLVEEKSDYYFDADDAQAFRNAFAEIGKEIAKSELRIKS